MTPDPDPPTPVGRKYTVRISTTFNNSHVIRFYHDDVLIVGGVATINTFNVLDPIVASESGDYRISAKIKAYDNTHPNWNDSYYDDATSCTIAGGSTYNIGAQADGTGFTVTQVNTTSLSISIWSQ